MIEIDKLRQLVSQPEGLKLEFKRQFHKINSEDPQVRKTQRDELVKDILSLANGNVGGSGQTGYLVIGVGDDLRDGSGRELFDVILPASPTPRGITQPQNNCISVS